MVSTVMAETPFIIQGVPVKSDPVITEGLHITWAPEDPLEFNSYIRIQILIIMDILSGEVGGGGAWGDIRSYLIFVR